MSRQTFADHVAFRVHNRTQEPPVLQRTDLIAFMPTADLGEFLGHVATGRIHSLHAWIVEGLRDHGLIDRHDRLTEQGHRVLAGE